MAGGLVKPRVCPTCSAVLGRETRHKASRSCAQVQAERRREATPERRKYHKKRMAKIRKRLAKQSQEAPRES